MTRSKGEKAKCQSGKNKETEPDQSGKANGIMFRGREREKRQRKTIMVALALCAIWSLIQHKKSTSTTNLVNSGNKSVCTQQIYTDDYIY